MAVEVGDAPNEKPVDRFGELNAEANRGDLSGCCQLEPNVMEVGPLEELTEVVSDEEVKELRPKLLPELKSLGAEIEEENRELPIPKEDGCVLTRDPLSVPKRGAD